MARIKVGIVNVTGYVGSELARILLQHPLVEITSVTGRGAVGKRVSEVFPHLSALTLKIEADLGEVDLAFSALPHKASAEAVKPLLDRGIKVVDTSADFRLKDASEYSLWYEFTHPAPELLTEAICGLPELHGTLIPRARLVANPGCYATSAILALAPAVKSHIIEGNIIIDSKSGISGAGRTPSLTTHFSEANENVSAYSVKGHRHLPEMVQELNAIGKGDRISVTFLPHLIPMTRGLLSSCYGRLKEGALPSSGKAEQEVRTLYKDFYREAPFTKVVDYPPQTKYTLGTNLCLIYPTIDVRTGTLMVVSCLDNLVKGGAGQAVQNMNLMLGFPETTSLEAHALYP
ncbi:MAG: N-acetyl-gamma-glutamyl-phosphate reductase [Chloroflexota bacterium]